MRSIGYGTEFPTLPVSVGHSEFRWGMLFLLLFVLVAVGRIQETIPALAPLRIGLVFGGLAGLFWLLAPGPTQSKLYLEIKQVRYVLILLGLGVITIPFSVWPGHSFDFVTNSYWKALFLLVMVLFWSRSLQDIDRLIWICCLGVTGLMLSSLLFPSEVEEELQRFNAGSYLYDPNDLAMVLVMMLPLVLYLFSTSRYRMRFLLLGMAFMCLYGVVLTRSRGGLLALLAVSGLILSRSSLSRAIKLTAVAIGLVVFAGLAGPEYWDRMQTISNPSSEYDRTAGGRTEIWKTGLSILANRPWGAGIDVFQYASGMTSGHWVAPHSSFLQVAVELGVAGFVVFVLLLGRTINELRQVRSGLQKARSLPKISPPLSPASGKGEEETLKHMGQLAGALEISLWGFVVAGFFLSQAYSMILYTMLGASLACIHLARTAGIRRPTVMAGSMAAARDRVPLRSPQV